MENSLKTSKMSVMQIDLTLTLRGSLIFTHVIYLGDAPHLILLRGCYDACVWQSLHHLKLLVLKWSYFNAFQIDRSSYLYFNVHSTTERICTRYCIVQYNIYLLCLKKFNITWNGLQSCNSSSKHQSLQGFITHIKLDMSW